MAAPIFVRACAGSSPLTRGTHFLSHSNGQSFRFIPAYAGNSRREEIESAFNQVHPRLRGELAETDDLEEGESRFIPAYAGNSKSRPGRTHSITVHPRLRGELCEICTPTSSAAGSSPLTRGTRRFGCFGHIHERFIPAYAGNSEDGHAGSVAGAVHPRLRGELT